jgi:hypothetical protein
MNFDKLKGAWMEDNAGEVSISLKNIPAGTPHSVIGQIRKMMRRELIAHLAVLFLPMLLLPFIKNPVSVLLATLAVSFSVIQSCYYLIRFYRFYKVSAHADLSIRKSIVHFTHDLAINIETYKTFIFHAIPLIVLILFSCSVNMTSFIMVNTGGIYALKYVSVFFVLMVLAVSQFFGLFLVHLHIQLHYSKPLSELKAITSELETEERNDA